MFIRDSRIFFGKRSVVLWKLRVSQRDEEECRFKRDLNDRGERMGVNRWGGEITLPKTVQVVTRPIVIWFTSQRNDIKLTEKSS